MILATYFILIFTAIQFLTVLSNYLWQQQLGADKIENNPLVSVLIPARNEAKNIGIIIDDIRAQTYQNIEIIVFDDHSTDDTARIVNEIAKNDNRIQLIQSTRLPKNWLGKNHACHQLSENAKGSYFIFLDADVRIKNKLISKSLAYSQKYELALLSIFPIQKMQSTGEKLTVPLMHYILLTLLPLILVRKSFFTAHSAANGQFMLFDSEVYKKYWPHRLFKSEKVEDIKISRFYKSKKQTVACLTGTNLITCRMYQNYTEAVNGFSKNIVMFFGNSVLFALLFWFTNTFGIIICLLTDIWLFVLYFILLISIRVLFSRIARQSVFHNLILFYPQMIVMFAIVYKSIINTFTKKQVWKGRYI